MQQEQRDRQKKAGNGMKLFRHGPLGSEAASAVDTRGIKRDISLLTPDLTPDWLAPREAERAFGHRSRKDAANPKRSSHRGSGRRITSVHRDRVELSEAR